MAGDAVTVRPIGDADVGAVSEFLHAELNQQVPAERWARVMSPPWPDAGPDHGVLLEADGRIVGAYLAVYSRRDLGGEPRPVCNLAAFCVLEEFRTHSVRLLRAVLARKGYDFTDLSPSGNVVALNERLRFRHLDTATWLVPNLPFPGGRGTTLTTDPEVLRRVLRGRDAAVFADHEHAAATRHVLVQSGAGYGYLVFRRDRRKGLRLFATPLYAGGDPECLRRGWRRIGSYLLLRCGLPVTLAEPRILGFRPGPGRRLGKPRARMVRGVPDLDGVDYLYSELALVEW
ncbi:MAG: hypothetical protein AAGC63_03520 [Propionicimonas sp.]|nr:hypothetical protein [Propionicimonas sp.]